MCRHAAFYWFVLDYMAAEMGDNVVTLQSELPESPFTLGAEGGRLVGAWGCLGGPGVLGVPGFPGGAWGSLFWGVFGGSWGLRVAGGCLFAAGSSLPFPYHRRRMLSMRMQSSFPS